MSDIKIQPSATGSATVTLTAPVSNTARTITLPDSTSTLSTFNPDGAVTINDSGADVNFRVESDTDTDALYIDGATGNVGMGASAGYGLGTGRKILTLEGASTTTIELAVSGARKGYIYHDATNISLATEVSGGDVDLVPHSTGDVKIANGDLVFTAAGKGICLGVTSNTDANTLDDYEEGTWQPSFVAGSGSVTAHASYSLCRYTKIGRVVQISGLVSCSGVSSPSGTLQMHGLPFAVDNNTSGETSGNAAIAIGGIVDLAASVHVLTMRPEPGTSYISIEEFTGTTTTGNTANKWQNGTYFRFSGTYTV